MSATWSYRDKLPRHGARDGDFVFDSSEGERAVRFFERRLWIPGGDRAGQRYVMPAWQDKAARALYGWRRRVPTITTAAAITRARLPRRYRRALVGIPRGNLKSSFGSGVALKGLTADGVAVPEIVGAGTDRRNAGKIFGYAAYSARRDRALRRRLEIFDGTKRITLRGREGQYEIIAADAAHAHGDHPTVVMIDDLQAQPRPTLLAKLRTSQINLEDSLLLMLMTANDEGKIGPGWEEWELALQLQGDPALDEQYLVCLFFADADDDIEDPAIQRKANPSIGISIPESEMRAQVARALARPSERVSILALHFNIWPDAVLKPAWIPSDQWDGTAGSVDESRLRGRECYVGVSATSSTAIASVAYVFPPGDEERGDFAVVLDAFVPEGRVAQLEDEDRISYRQWIEDGWLTSTPGSVIDEDAIVAAVERRVAQGWRIQQVAWHPRGPISLARKLQEIDLDVAAVTPGRASMSPAMREFEKLVLARRLHHGGDRLLAWMMRGLRARRNAEGDVWPDGEASTGNITGPLAALMALSRHLAPLGGEERVQAWG